jgi:3'-phosphoadenosine 5'-phosphosulfate sulfotransferase (PAPS reductase)/FAD synthetase
MNMYLSYGGGVNSTAMLLLLKDEGWKFESIYVDHGCDWPETREYVRMLSAKYPITILTPNVQGCTTLLQYLDKYKLIPSRVNRFCTDRFKIKVFNKYVEKPCFSLIGFSTDEEHRAKLSITDRVENRFPLLEYGISRKDCEKIIKNHGLPVPIKSGCWFCPFQRVGQWRKLRRDHPDLFCRARELEDNQNIARAKRGKKKPIYLCDRPLDLIVNEAQEVLFKEDKPPCNCML